MGRYIGPKTRIARRFGATNIFGKGKPSKRPGHPGQHGAKRKAKPTQYGLQLLEKQKLRAVYGMLRESQLVQYYQAAVKAKGSTPDILVSRLERRLDVSVYRLGLAPTIFAAQQYVSHGHVLVNGKRVDIRSYKVEVGQEISLTEASMNSAHFKAHLEKKVSAPDYWTWDGKVGKLLREPKHSDVQFPIEIDIPGVCVFLGHNN